MMQPGGDWAIALMPYDQPRGPKRAKATPQARPGAPSNPSLLALVATALVLKVDGGAFELRLLHVR